ncbi:hypothetical protein [Massilia sp. NP310]|uniref:hypothetical protein n=1 Tax=Massilia sp. NP310 TaxID=2861282 RepID=UPI001C625B5A|nr:hypothetical protein [Massilia sp. NP310]QYG04019.1 hypothetical protein KY496_11875 [Massilia sp. NP310]
MAITANSPLNEREENFARLVARGENQSSAYAIAYGHESKGAQTKANGSRLANKPNVHARIEFYKAAYASKVATEIEYEVKDALHEINEAMSLAKTCEHPTAMLGAIRLKCELKGLIGANKADTSKPLTGEELDKSLAGLLGKVDLPGLLKATAPASASLVDQVAPKKPEPAPELPTKHELIEKAKALNELDPPRRGGRTKEEMQADQLDPVAERFVREQPEQAKVHMPAIPTHIAAKLGLKKPGA